MGVVRCADRAGLAVRGGRHDQPVLRIGITLTAFGSRPRSDCLARNWPTCAQPYCGHGIRLCTLCPLARGPTRSCRRCSGTPGESLGWQARRAPRLRYRQANATAIVLPTVGPSGASTTNWLSMGAYFVREEDVVGPGGAAPIRGPPRAGAGGRRSRQGMLSCPVHPVAVGISPRRLCAGPLVGCRPRWCDSGNESRFGKPGCWERAGTGAAPGRTEQQRRIVGQPRDDQRSIHLH
ncbi:hypothetical protein HNR67_003316 [Crossiella cryophila]|uniref:Uncharacterized protein n=1 Tax=Crossiella cryophila TaxID=43355 RepID=A0A7W7FU90_9PSEU|nr:hypothetical protein [Crossiella cryophila]